MAESVMRRNGVFNIEKSNIYSISTVQRVNSETVDALRWAIDFAERKNEKCYSMFLRTFLNLL